MLSSLIASVFAADAGVVVKVLFGFALAGLATSLAAPARLGMRAEILLATLSTEGGAEGSGPGAVGAFPPMEVANPAKDEMLVAMTSVTLARVGKPGPPTRASLPAQDRVQNKVVY